MPLPLTPEATRQLKFYLDGLGYSFEIAKVCARRLRETVDALAAVKDADAATNEQAASALLDAWALVDMCHRVRELIQQTPGFKVNTPAVQLFLRATEAVVTLRNHVQHFRSGIPSLPPQVFPLWGTLGWVSTTNPDRAYLLVTGNINEGVESYSLTYDQHESCFVSKLMLSAEKTSIDLELVSSELVKAKEAVITWIKSDSRLNLDPNGVPLIMTLQILKP